MLECRSNFPDVKNNKTKQKTKRKQNKKWKWTLIGWCFYYCYTICILKIDRLQLDSTLLSAVSKNCIAWVCVQWGQMWVIPMNMHCSVYLYLYRYVCVCAFFLLLLNILTLTVPKVLHTIAFLYNKNRQCSTGIILFFSLTHTICYSKLFPLYFQLISVFLS